MAQGGSSMLQSMLECPICQEELTHPRVLPCQHNFCHECLRKTLQHQAKADSLTCPLCRTVCQLPHAGVDALPKNIFVINLIEATHTDGLIRESQKTDDDHESTCCSVDPDACSRTATFHCDKCGVYMCPDCEKTHRYTIFTKNHKTTSVKEAQKVQKLPPCPKHSHMYLDIFCEECNIPICATCGHLEHREHSCTELSSKMESFHSQLDKVLAQTGRCLAAVQKAIQTSQQQAAKAEQDVEVLKQQTSASYQAIQQHIQQQERKHLEEIDQAHHKAKKMAAETLDRQQTMEATLQSIELYGQRLKKKGTPYDFTTNLMSLAKRSEQEANKPTPSLKWGVDVKWGEWEGRADVKGVRLVFSSGKEEAGDDSSLKLLGSVTTEWQETGIGGIVSWNNHIIAVHCNHDSIYVYNKENKLKRLMRVSGMRNPFGISLVQEKGGTQHIVLCDRDGQCLWWLKIEEQRGQLSIGQPQQRKLVYRPHEVTSDRLGRALVTDHDNSRLHLYRHSLHEQWAVCLPSQQQVKPVVAVSNPTGGYVIIDQHYQLVWLNTAGQVIHRYTDLPAIHASHIAHDGIENWLVADWNNHCVHVVTEEGRHAGFLITQQQGIRKPHYISVDTTHHRVWLAYKGEKNKVQLMEVEYPASQSTSLTLSATLPKI